MCRIKRSVLLLVLVFGFMMQGEATNVALNKPAAQSSYYSRGTHPASLGNNGWKERLQENSDRGEITYTLDRAKRWWKVDLEGDYYIRDIIIYNRLDCCEARLSSIYLLTASKASPEDPVPGQNDWIIRWYKTDTVASSGDERIALYTTDTVRHVAIYKASPYPLSLREVEVFNYPNPQDAPANQIDTTSVQLSSGDQPNAGSTDGLIDMFDGFYETVQAQTRWTARLYEPCDRCYVKVYPRLSIATEFQRGDFSELSNFTIRVHDRTGTTPPDDGWTVCGTYIHNQNGPLIAECVVTGINFIGIINNKRDEGLKITEVQVFPREPKDGVIQITNIQPANYECVNFALTILNTTTANRLFVRWICTGKAWSERLFSSTRTVQSCGHEAFSNITCQLMTIGNGGVSKESEPKSTITLDCTAPSEPSFNVTVGTNSNQTRGAITIANIKVNNINCNHQKELSIIVTSMNVDKDSEMTWSSSGVATDNKVFDNLDGVTNYTVRITVFNNRDKSSFTEKNVTTGSLRSAQVSSLRVFGSSTDCITITWRPPNLPNGVITGYKVKCGNRTEKTKSATDSSHEECNYSPNTEATCTVKAVNVYSSLGVADSKTATTLCGKPSTPTFNLTDVGTHTLEDGKLRRKIRVSNVQVTEQKCNSLNKVEIFLYEGHTPIGNKVTQNGTDIDNNVDYRNLDAVTEYRVEILAYNDKNNVSNKAVQTKTTGELPPDTAPVIVGLDLNISCGILEWRQPDEPNGVILSYQIVCRNLNKIITQQLSQDQDQFSFCALMPSSLVNCSITANNSIGWSPEASTAGFTKPSFGGPEINVTTTAKPQRLQFQLIHLTFLTLLLIPAAVVVFILIRRKVKSTRAHNEDKRNTQLSILSQTSQYSNQYTSQTDTTDPVKPQGKNPTPVRVIHDYDMPPFQRPGSNYKLSTEPDDDNAYMEPIDVNIYKVPVNTNVYAEPFDTNGYAVPRPTDQSQTNAMGNHIRGIKLKEPGEPAGKNPTPVRVRHDYDTPTVQRPGSNYKLSTEPADDNAYMEPIDVNIYKVPVNTNVYAEPFDVNGYAVPTDQNKTNAMGNYIRGIELKEPGEPAGKNLTPVRVIHDYDMPPFQRPGSNYKLSTEPDDDNAYMEPIDANIYKVPAYPNVYTEPADANRVPIYENKTTAMINYRGIKLRGQGSPESKIEDVSVYDNAPDVFTYETENDSSNDSSSQVNDLSVCDKPKAAVVVDKYYMKEREIKFTTPDGDYRLEYSHSDTVSTLISKIREINHDWRISITTHDGTRFSPSYRMNTIYKECDRISLTINDAASNIIIIKDEGTTVKTPETKTTKGAISLKKRRSHLDQPATMKTPAAKTTEREIRLKKRRSDLGQRTKVDTTMPGERVFFC